MGVIGTNERLDNAYRQRSLEAVSPLGEGFDEAYFDRLLAAEKKDMSVKEFLATRQRIPGLGNGVLQDMLFHARLAPRCRISTLSDAGKSGLFRALKDTLGAMTKAGGRSTELDFFGRPGGYECVLSKNTWERPCSRCGGAICKAAYLGGSVYWCADCQRM